MQDIAARPNLLGGDPGARVRDLLEQRRDAYAESHLSLSSDALEPAAIVDAIVALQARDPLLVPLGSRSYCIDVCDDDPTRLTDAVARCAPSSIVLVTDSNVKRARGSAIEAALRPFPFQGTRVVLPPGETFKTVTSVCTIWDAALGAGLDRDALVVAAGGGVIGDMAGFAAATLLRGIRFVQVPTTLLAMVDASVGGKTGFDHPAGKNLIGAFHQPSAVVADLAHLKTLSARERTAGLAEVVKIAITSDEPLLALLERDSAALARGDHEALLPVIRRAIEAKIRVVRDDERESGSRALLNLGHTVGHALEAHGGYTRWLHGEAVALGLVIEMEATAELGWTPRELVDRVKALLGALGLPTETSRAEVASSWPYVAADKKRTKDSVRLPVALDAGQARLEKVALIALEKSVRGPVTGLGAPSVLEVGGAPRSPRRRLAFWRFFRGGGTLPLVSCLTGGVGMKRLIARAIAGLTLLGGGGMLFLACSHDNSSIFVQDVLAPQLVTAGSLCVFTSQTTQATISSGVLDTDFVQQYNPDVSRREETSWSPR